MYIMTDRGYRPLWSLDPVSAPVVEFAPLLAKFTTEEREAIASVRQDYIADQFTAVKGLREAYEAKINRKVTVLYAVAKGHGTKKMYLSTNDENEVVWRYGSFYATWRKEVHPDFADALKTGAHYITAKAFNDLTYKDIPLEERQQLTDELVEILHGVKAKRRLLA